MTDWFYDQIKIYACYMMINNAFKSTKKRVCNFIFINIVILKKKPQNDRKMIIILKCLPVW